MRFFDDADMDFALRCVLSGVRHGMAEVGETLTTAEQITDGDPASWLAAFVGLGRRLRRVADEAAAHGHGVSAWNAALRSANYLYAGAWWAPATAAAEDRLELWGEHRSAWDLAVEHWPSPVEDLPLHCGGAEVTARWFTSAAAPERAAAVVLVGGLGTPVSDLCMTGLDGALLRGHHVLVVEGPGQGAALYEAGRTLDDSWTELLCAAVAAASRRPGVDPDHVGLLGVGAGALFAARAAAALGDRADHPGPCALVLDPGVVDLGADAAASLASARDDRSRRLLAWGLTDPTGIDDAEQAVAALAAHRLEGREAASITCPTLVVTAEDAWGFRGQGESLLADLRAPVTRIELRAADGAGADNGIDASQVHDAAVYDWWDATLSVGAPTGEAGATTARR